MKTERLELKVSKRWLRGVDDAVDGLKLNRSEFLRLAVEAVVHKDVIPAPLLSEAIQTIEDAQGHLRGEPRSKRLVEMLDDAITCITAAEDLEWPEDMVWPR